MNPFTPKIDHNLNSPHKINTPTKMVSIRTRENLNWTIIFCPKRNVTTNSRNDATKKLILVSWENFSLKLRSS